MSTLENTGSVNIESKEFISPNHHLFLGLVLNSLSSVLTYNTFDVEQMFGDKKKGNHHETSFVKQLGYCIIMIILNLW